MNLEDVGHSKSPTILWRECLSTNDQDGLPTCPGSSFRQAFWNDLLAKYFRVATLRGFREGWDLPPRGKGAAGTSPERLPHDGQVLALPASHHLEGTQKQRWGRFLRLTNDQGSR
jgi:hypothetical protein